MALKISYINQEAPSPKVAVDARLYRTADGTRLVPEGHPDAAFLFCAPGHEVSRAEFERFELDPSLAPEAASAAVEEPDRGEDRGAAEGEVPDAEAAAESEGEPDADAGEEKAVEGPPEDKAVRKRRTKKAKG